MARSGSKIRWVAATLIALGVLAGLLVFGVPRLVETAWARGVIVKGLEQATHRNVSLGRVDFTWLGGLRAHDLVIEQRTGSGELLRLSELSIDVSLLGLLRRQIDVQELHAEGPQVVLVRNKNGTFNIADLLGGESGGSPPRMRVPLSIDDGQVRYVDRVLGVELVLSELDARVVYHDGALSLRGDGELEGADVSVRASAHLDQEGTPFVIDELQVKDFPLGPKVAPAGLFFPLLGTAPASPGGTFSLSLNDVSASGVSLADLRASLSGEGRVRLRDASLQSEPLSALVTALHKAGLEAPLEVASESGALALGDVDTKLTIADGKVQLPELKLGHGDVYLTMAGSTGLDSRLDYDLMVHGVQELLPDDAKRSPLRELDTVPLSLSGTLAQPRVSVNVRTALEGAVEGVVKDEAEKRAEDFAERGLDALRRRVLD